MLRVLSALPREEERDGSGRGGACPAAERGPVFLPSAQNRVRRVPADDRPPVRELLASNLQGERDVGHVHDRGAGRVARPGSRDRRIRARRASARTAPAPATAATGRRARPPALLRGPRGRSCRRCRTRSRRPAAAPRCVSRPTASAPCSRRTGCPRNRSSGFGVSKCRLGGISPCSSASVALIRPATPAAESRWPTLVLSVPIATVCGATGPKACVSAAISIGSPSAVPVPCAST